MSGGANTVGSTPCFIGNLKSRGGDQGTRLPPTIGVVVISSFPASSLSDQPTIQLSSSI